jgi:hypothetical protein
MTTLLTRNIDTMTGMREPHKVLKKSGGEPWLFCATPP